MYVSIYHTAVGIATGYGLVDLGVGVQVRLRIFTFLYRPDWLWGPPSLLSSGYWVFFSLGVKWTGQETYHLPPTSAKVKKTWIYTSTPPYIFMAKCLVS
jgi:hypothetical protein